MVCQRIGTPLGSDGASKGRWFVAFGDVRVVESAFGCDAALEILGAGAPALGHHHPAITAGNDRDVGQVQWAGGQAHSVGNSSALPGRVV